MLLVSVVRTPKVAAASSTISDLPLTSLAELRVATLAAYRIKRFVMNYFMSIWMTRLGTKYM